MSFLGKRRPSSPRRASEIRLHRGGEGHLSRAGAVPDPGGIPRRLLRVAHAAPGAPDPAGSAARRRDSGDSRRDPPGLCARRRRRFRITTDSNHPLAVAPNVLARHFTVPAPDTAWVTDITYLWTQEGWLYLAVILDLFSRAVVGWALSARITRHLTLQALTMALGRRRPPQGLLHHSDRGSQYASADYRRALRVHGIVCSMSRRGNCWDNAVAESFFATVKVELA